MWTDALLIGLGGACGALARYGADRCVLHWLGNGFPWGTLIVNLLGCFLLGLLWGVMGQTAARRWGLFAGVGFLGSFTTFSTLAAQAGQQLNDGQFAAAFANLVGSVVVGVVLVMLGAAVGNWLHGPAE